VSDGYVSILSVARTNLSGSDIARYVGFGDDSVALR
jgi:hypothetical protein